MRRSLFIDQSIDIGPVLVGLTVLDIIESDLLVARHVGEELDLMWGDEPARHEGMQALMAESGSRVHGIGSQRNVSTRDVRECIDQVSRHRIAHFAADYIDLGAFRKHSPGQAKSVVDGPAHVHGALQSSTFQDHAKQRRHVWIAVQTCVECGLLGYACIELGALEAKFTRDGRLDCRRLTLSLDQRAHVDAESIANLCNSIANLVGPRLRSGVKFFVFWSQPEFCVLPGFQVGNLTLDGLDPAFYIPARFDRCHRL